MTKQNDDKKIVLYSKDLIERGYFNNPVTLWRHIEKGTFPKPFKIGSKNAWKKSDVDDWLLDREVEDIM